MKTIYRTIILMLSLSIFAGCEKRESILEEPTVELSATMEYELKTKTSLSDLADGYYYPLWSSADEIGVYADEDKVPVKFTLKTGAGTTGATFSGTREGENYLAIYPYSAAGNIENGAISLILPQIQQYVAGSFGPDSYPMIARSTSSGQLEFKNLCAVMKISITGEAAIRSIKLTAKDENTFLSGNAKVDVGYETSPQLQMADGGSNSVILDCDGTELSKDTVTDFHIVIPAQMYKGGFDIEIDVYSDTVVKSVSSDLQFQRSQIRHLKGMELNAEKPEINYDAIPDNEIWYVMSDGIIYDIYLTTKQYGHQPFDAKVISNTYQNGYGIIKFDAPVTQINDYTFGNGWAANMTELYLPDCIEYIGTGAIHNTGLTTLHIPKNLKFVGSYGLNNSNLKSFRGEHISEDGRCVIIEDGFMPNYGNTQTPVKNYMAAFAPAGISEYSLPNNVEILGWNAFAWCPELRKITFNEGLKTILGDCFVQTHLDCEIILPSTLEELNSYAFRSCSGIKGFYGNEKFHTSDHLCLIFEQMAFIEPEKNGKWINSFVGYDLTDYSIPEGIKGLENYSFANKSMLRKIYFPQSLLTIGGHAFEGTTNIEEIEGPNVLQDKRSLVVGDRLVYVAGKGLKSYKTPENVVMIDDAAFRFKTDLENIVLSDNVRNASNYTFMGCENLREVTISARMEFLGYDPFESWETPMINTVYCRAVIPPTVYYNGTPDNPSFNFENLTIYIPKGSMNLYLANSGWAPYHRYLKEYEYTDLPQPDYYISTDYSQDGVPATLQSATEGKGINVVLLGDGYSDRQIADGTYKRDMEFAYNNLFTEEPYNSYRNLFNVSYVNVVSPTEGFDYGSTALSCGFGDGTYVYGNDNKCFEYAQKVVDGENINETLIVVVLNSNRYAGTCFMYYPVSSGDYGSGPAVAYFPKGEDETVFAQLLHHEACGHGFAKLADEYAYEYMGTIPMAEVTNTQTQQSEWGWWKNVDFTDDLALIKWARFISDTRYQYDGLGAFEGGLTYWSGVWRPTDNSIMRYNYGGFNAPSREAIYYRMHKLAYGSEWEYDYEKFAEYDAVNRKSSAEAAMTTSQVLPLQPMEPTHPPVVVPRQIYIQR